MKHIIFLILLVSALAIACTGTSKTKKSTEIDVPSGEKLFKKYCTSCHGFDGKLAFNGAKDLNTSVMNLDDRVLLIRTGRKLMTPFKDILSPREIKSVAAYTLKFKSPQ